MTGIQVSYGIDRQLNFDPPFQNEIVNLKVGLLEELILTCSSSGSPQPQTTWYKSSSINFTVTDKVAGGPLFEIPEVTTTHRGYYRCQVNNSFDGQSSTMSSNIFLVNITGEHSSHIIVLLCVC